MEVGEQCRVKGRCLVWLGRGVKARPSGEVRVVRRVGGREVVSAGGGVFGCRTGAHVSSFVADNTDV